MQNRFWDMVFLCYMNHRLVRICEHIGGAASNEAENGQYNPLYTLYIY